MNQDQQHLRLLSIFHYILGGLTIVGCLMGGIMYVFMGTMFSRMPAGTKDAPPAGFGSIFVAVGVAFIVVGLIFGTLKIVAGVKLGKHESRIFCLVIAALECLNMPLGTALGVFTIIVLLRPSVISLFEGGEQSIGSSGPPMPTQY
jgi:hypothetical protein